MQLTPASAALEKFSDPLQAPLLPLHLRSSKFANQVWRVFVDDDVEKRKKLSCSSFVNLGPVKGQMSCLCVE